jgi:hypothetical protein
MQTDNVSKTKRWNRDVKFRLAVFNQLDTNKTIAKGKHPGYIYFDYVNMSMIVPRT